VNKLLEIQELEAVDYAAGMKILDLHKQPEEEATSDSGDASNPSKGT
jgi:hypothetical protein